MKGREGKGGDVRCERITPTPALAGSGVWFLQRLDLLVVWEPISRNGGGERRRRGKAKSAVVVGVGKVPIDRYRSEAASESERVRRGCV